MKHSEPASQPLGDASRRQRFAQRVAVSGTAASIFSFAAACVMARCAGNSAIAVLNAPSQWVWGEAARTQTGLSFRYTAVGMLIHQLSSLLWASAFEAWYGVDPKQATRKGLAIGTAAYLIDYQVVPQRLRPGCEVSVPRPAIPLGYVAFGLGLALAVFINDARSRRP